MPERHNLHNRRASVALPAEIASNSLSLPEAAGLLHVHVLPLRAGGALLVYCRRSMTCGYGDSAFQACFNCIFIFCHVLRRNCLNFSETFYYGSIRQLFLAIFLCYKI